VRSIENRKPFWTCLINCEVLLINLVLTMIQRLTDVNSIEAELHPNCICNDLS
jgi:hypothetical protein